MDVTTIRTAGLGNSTYLLTHEGIGILVDPQRDVDRFLEAVAAADVTLRWVLETHLHNDYVSGGAEAARRSGAQLVLPAGAGVAFDYVPAFHCEDLAAAPLTVRPLHTPGHTPEHTSYLILVDSQPAAVFSGGSLLVASAGRTDLLGQERARQLAKLQYASLQRLVALPDHVGLYPTHGEGSFCTASSAGRTTSTIGREKAENPALRYPDVEAFADGQLSGLPPHPTYYAHMGPINVLGPDPMPDLDIPELAPDDLAALDNVALVDARPRAAFAAAHVPGSLSVELDDDFGTWVGWLLPFNVPLVLVAGTEADAAEADAAEAARQLARVGFDDVRGFLRGIDAWQASGRSVASFDLVELHPFVDALERGEARQVLDVRSPAEWEDARLDTAVHRYLPDLPDGVPAGLDKGERVWIACHTGHRASIAASLLEQAGYTPVVLSGAGIPDVLEQRRAAREDGAPQRVNGQAIHG